MPLINRLSQLFKADANAILDCIEDPEQLLKQAIREMQDNINQHVQQLKRLNYEAQKISGNEVDIQHSIKQLDEELDICLASEKQDLARIVIRKKLLAQRILQNNTGKQKMLKKKISNSEKHLSDKQNSLLSMQQKSDVLIQCNEDVYDFSSAGTSLQDLNIKDEDIEVALLRALKMRLPS